MPGSNTCAVSAVPAILVVDDPVAQVDYGIGTSACSDDDELNKFSVSSVALRKLVDYES
jgi:hypothetical protein